MNLITEQCNIYAIDTLINSHWQMAIGISTVGPRQQQRRPRIAQTTLFTVWQHFPMEFFGPDIFDWKYCFPDPESVHWIIRCRPRPTRLWRTVCELVFSVGSLSEVPWQAKANLKSMNDISANAERESDIEGGCAGWLVCKSFSFEVDGYYRVFTPHRFHKLCAPNLKSECSRWTNSIFD